MRAAFYTEQGPAKAVFQIGNQPTPEPGPGEVRVKLRISGVNPSDWKVRKGGFGRGLASPIVIPHSDGAGVIDVVGNGVAASAVSENALRVMRFFMCALRVLGRSCTVSRIPVHSHETPVLRPAPQESEYG